MNAENDRAKMAGDGAAHGKELPTSAPAQHAATSINEVEEQTINPAALANVRQLALPNEPDPLPEVIDLFLADTTSRLRQMEQSIQNRDARGLEAAAHSLKGSSGSLGAEIMVRLCVQAMQLAVRSEFVPASETLAQLRLEFAKVDRILRAERSRPQS
jgi:HPt (histidine-containing phosphotransfer) domain-containing protein